MAAHRDLTPFRRVLVALVTIVAVFAVSTSALQATKGSTHVKTYTKKNGTVVQAHERKAKAAPPPKPLTDKQKLKRADDYLKRSDAARRAFMRQTGYPHGRPGYVIDHIVPLACHGADAPSNMQWQTIEDAKQKDRTERIGCR